MNINDSEGVKALLNQLRFSQAWQDALSTPPAHTIVADAPAAVGTTQAAPANSSSVPSVATLLSQLQSAPAISESRPTAPSTHQPHQPHQPSIEPPPRIATTPVPSQQDVKSYTFQQALPHLAQLSEDSNFVRPVTQIKQQQADLERQLWEERQNIQQKYDEKVRVARMKATMIGAVLTKHEADTLNHAFQKDLHKFDVERVLPAWDGLVIKQQAALEGAGVPTMFVTDVPVDRERQQRVIRVLEAISG